MRPVSTRDRLLREPLDEIAEIPLVPPAVLEPDRRAGVGDCGGASAAPGEPRQQTAGLFLLGAEVHAT